MSFRFLKLTTAYPEYVRDLAVHPSGGERPSFAQLEQALHSKGWGLSSNYSAHFQKRGHEAREIYASIEPLQKAWAAEHGVAADGKDWKKRIVLAQIKSFAPDIVFLHDLWFFDSDFRKAIRSAVLRGTMIVGWRFAPIDDYASFADLDCVFTGNSTFAESFRRAGVRAEVLPLSFDIDMLTALGPLPERDLSMTFAGSIGDNAYYHAERHRFLEEMLAHSPLLLWGRTVRDKPLPALRRWRWNALYHANMALDRAGLKRPARAKIPVLKRGASWLINPAAPSLQERYPERVFPPVFGLDYMKLLARSKIALNNHSEIVNNSSGNMRMFEATGMGACLLTDQKADIRTFFEPDREIVTYRSAAEAADKSRELLGNDKLREDIARAGHERTLRAHTLENRACLLEGFLVDLKKIKPAS